MARLTPAQDEAQAPRLAVARRSLSPGRCRSLGSVGGGCSRSSGGLARPRGSPHARLGLNAAVRDTPSDGPRQSGRCQANG